MPSVKMTRAERCAQSKARNATRKEARQIKAGALIERRRLISDATQLAMLEKLFPDGAKKEKARLKAKLAAPAVEAPKKKKQRL